MLPTSRCIGGVARPRDLRVLAKSNGRPLDVLKEPLSAGSCSHDSGLQEQTSAAPLREISTAPQTRVDTCLLAQSGQLSPVSPQARAFHTSARVPYYSSSYNGSTVPDFFVKYKQHRAAPSTSSTVEHGGLMHPLTESISTGDVVATTRRLKSKIPVEHVAADGHVVHSSGFVVPAPGQACTTGPARAKERERNEHIDRAMQTGAVAHRILESDYGHVKATTLPSFHKIPFEVREPDGTVKHASGFVPPTPAHKFRYTVSASVFKDRKFVQHRVRQPSPSRAVLRAVHTASAPIASEDA